jgi:hypothetical protein
MHHVILGQWETAGLSNTVTLPYNRLQALIGRGIEMPFPTAGAYPGWDVVYIYCLVTKTEPGLDPPVLNCPVTELASESSSTL